MTDDATTEGIATIATIATIAATATAGRGMENLLPDGVLRLGPITLSATVGGSLLASALVVALAILARPRPAGEPSSWQVALEAVIEHLEDLLRDLTGGDPRPYVPLVVTLALYIAAANVLGVVPGLRSPTADLATTSALAAIVFLAVPVYGIRARGLGGYLRHYLEPTPLLLPITIVAELSRTVAMAIRLFGNVVSGELVVGILVLLAGLLVPVPLMALELLVGIVQAYIFAVLAAVYLGAAVRSGSG